jgi:hypothetical protein
MVWWASSGEARTEYSLLAKSDGGLSYFLSVLIIVRWASPAEAFLPSQCFGRQRAKAGFILKDIDSMQEIMYLLMPFKYQPKIHC